MTLTGPQVQQICDALRSAFTPASLRTMVRVGMNETLEEITAQADMRTMVFELVTWAERYGRVDDLLIAAYQQNSSSPPLRQLVATWPSAAVAAAAAGTPAAGTTVATPPAAAAAQPPNPPPDLTPQLRKVLAGLFDNKADAAILARDAGLDTAYIAADGNISTYWDAILREARNQELTATLLQRALDRYPRNPDLRRLAQSYGLV